MEFHEFLKYQKAIDLLREQKVRESTYAIQAVNQVSSASFKLFVRYSVTGLKNTKKIGESTVEDLMDTIFPFGIKKSDLEPFMDKAKLLVETTLGPE